MKKLLLLGAFVAFGYVGVNAQAVSVSAQPTAVSVSDISNDKSAKLDKKDQKTKKDKACGDEKSKSCKSAEKKSCCSDKGHTEAAPAKKEEGK